MNTFRSIRENIAALRERIATAVARSGRSGGNIKLVAVTKTNPVESIREALSAGITDIGENRIQEAVPKMLELNTGGSGVRKHFLGHLQTNKVKKAVEFFDVIQSVDSLRLLEAINREAEKAAKTVDCMFELKISEEDSKYGILPGELQSFLKETGRFAHVKITGMMTMAPYFEDPEKARPYFKEARRLFEEHISHFGVNPTLSAGMSNDFEVAVEEGSNMVRVGTAIFGERAK